MVAHRRLLRGFTEEDFEQVAEFFDRGVNLTIDIKGKTGTKLADFKAALSVDAYAKFPELAALTEEIKNFSKKFPTIGY